MIFQSNTGAEGGLKEKLSILKAQQVPTEKADIRAGCYYFEKDDTRLYCTACYDLKGMK
ncbi:MAG: hypothetical protein HAW66_10355 [Shewanella sp.]|nr:hypothetical protein [Shewanella sp.]